MKKKNYVGGGIPFYIFSIILSLTAGVMIGYGEGDVRTAGIGLGGFQMFAIFVTGEYKKLTPFLVRIHIFANIAALWVTLIPASFIKFPAAAFGMGFALLAMVLLCLILLTLIRLRGK
jgi:hypothetical protein